MGRRTNASLFVVVVGHVMGNSAERDSASPCPHS